jgi:hypothetical protein
LRFNASNQARDCGKAAQQDETDVIATEAMVAEVPKKNAGAGGMPPGGGGMGGRVAWTSKSRPFRNLAIRKAWPFLPGLFLLSRAMQTSSQIRNQKTLPPNAPGQPEA